MWGRFSLLQPLSMRRLEHEKRRKEIKEQWHRAQRKLVSDRTGFVLPGAALEHPMANTPLRMLRSAPLQQCWVLCPAVLGGTRGTGGACRR